MDIELFVERLLKNHWKILVLLMGVYRKVSKWYCNRFSMAGERLLNGY